MKMLLVELIQGSSSQFSIFTHIFLNFIMVIGVKWCLYSYRTIKGECVYEWYL
jgi:hypothetical protein